MTQRESWRSRITFLLSSIGFAAGIGNLWRFPYLVGKYGGGIFLLFYLVAVALIGISLLATEISLGRATQKDPVGAYKKLAPQKFWFLNGYLNVFTMVLISGYSSIVGGWIMAYFFKTIAGGFANMAAPEIAESFHSFVADPVEVIIWTAVFIGALTTVLLKGLNRGVETANRLMLPALSVIMLILLARALTLPGLSKGLVFFLKPEMSHFSLEGALAALGQAFFSIGIAMAAGLVYGSYLGKGEKIISNAVIIAFADTLIAIVAGLIIFPSVAAFGLEPGAGPGLTFITMPNVFNQMPLGNIFGALFYLLFFLAAFTSFLGGAEAIVAHLRDEWHMTRTRGVTITAAAMLCIAIPSAFTTTVFSTLDSLVNNYLLIIGALVMTLFAGWVWPINKFFEEAGVRSKTLKVFWGFNIKFLVPAIIVMIWLSQLGILG